MNRIVILCYNKVKLSCRCIQATLDAGYPLSQLSVIDNGSDEILNETLRKTFPDIEILCIDKNKGFAGGFTQGLKQHFEKHTCDSALFLTNDTQIHPGCLEACEETARITGAGIVAPCLMFRKEKDRIDSIGARFDRLTGNLHHLTEPSLAPILSEDEYIPGTALWLTRRSFDALGGTDESYVMYWEDVDFSFRAHHLGIIQARCYGAKIQHGIGQTCHKKPIYTTFYFQRNRIRFCKKWLTEAQWENVRPRIESDLNSLEHRAKKKNDTNRLQYLHDIRSEL